MGLTGDARSTRRRAGIPPVAFGVHLPLTREAFLFILGMV